MRQPRIRPAVPEDLAFLVQIMRTAATSHLPVCVWDALFGVPAAQVDALFASVACSERPHWCHLERFWVAELGGRPVAALSTFDTSTEGNEPLEQELLARAASTGSIDFEATLVRAVALGRGMPPSVPGTWGIENVAVEPEQRGTGVVDLLLHHAIELGRDRGYTQAQVLCLNGNIRAERAWQRNGFELHSDYRDTSFEQTYGCPGLRLYLRAP